ncbi:ATP-dependent zinc metalloprotease FTSH, chloroplastic [Tanacetum coccineum]
MFKPRLLLDAYRLARFQETANNLVKGMTKASFVENGFKHNKIDESQVGVHYNEYSIMDFDKVYREAEKSSESESNVSCKVDVDGMVDCEEDQEGHEIESRGVVDNNIDLKDLVEIMDGVDWGPIPPNISVREDEFDSEESDGEEHVEFPKFQTGVGEPHGGVRWGGGRRDRGLGGAALAGRGDGRGDGVMLLVELFTKGRGGRRATRGPNVGKGIGTEEDPVVVEDAGVNAGPTTNKRTKVNSFVDMDNASIIATFPADLREEVCIFNFVTRADDIEFSMYMSPAFSTASGP